MFVGEEKIELIVVPFLPQLSYQCHWQLLLEDGWKEQGAKPKGERTIVRKQSNSTGKKQTKSSLPVNSLVCESLYGHDSSL